MISLIMPFKNTAAYLSDCLDSILEQSYKEWELIMVNDHSTDDSYMIAQAYANKEERIHLLENKGAGIIKALQRGYSFSSGSFISRMDSDDRMHPERLNHMINALKAKGLGHLAVGQVQYFSTDGISDGYARYEKWLNALTQKGSNYKELYKECVIPSPCWMAYRADFDRCGGFQKERYPEDYDLTFRFYAGDLTLIPCDQVLHYWRDYPQRTSRNSVHYAQNFFLDLKLHYFLKLHYQPERPLVIWGAGTKGKHLAAAFQNEGVPFSWMCDNPNKIGKTIYGVSMQDYQEIDHLEHPQIIVTVANPQAQGAILQFFHLRQMESLRDFFFFC
ncbi:glycosyltransferase family 2 protein [Aureicoccus marinus]|uniref:Glycosyl transferase family 2 n=1 Tax=Aureicoccus marinus TaxID=754435 RepID=A0A2S7T659_9FLAO|nr:glycosyltransferase family 2 protein [Aureicoccus marinus]PQJ15078.1 glycosyl transferase family 2 [Aureicoccus marinus]